MKTTLKAVTLGIAIYWISAMVVLAMISLNSCNTTVTKVLEIPEKPIPQPTTVSLFGSWNMSIKTVGGACNGIESISRIIIDSKDDTIVSIALTGVTHFESSGNCVVDDYESKNVKVKNGLLTDIQTRDSLQLYFDTVLNGDGNDGSTTTVESLSETEIVIKNKINKSTDTIKLTR